MIIVIDSVGPLDGTQMGYLYKQSGLEAWQKNRLDIRPLNRSSPQGFIIQLESCQSPKVVSKCFHYAARCNTELLHDC